MYDFKRFEMEDPRFPVEQNPYKFSLVKRQFHPSPYSTGRNRKEVPTPPGHKWLLLDIRARGERHYRYMLVPERTTRAEAAELAKRFRERIRKQEGL